MLVDPGRTPYDLNFGVFGFRVRVHPFFWLGAGLLGSQILQSSVYAWLIWIAVVFVSILVHEMGPAIAFRGFGRNAHIVLYAFGGLAIPNSDVSGRFRRILVSLAGPFAGFLLAGILYGSNRLHPWATENGPYVFYIYFFLFSVNFFWGLLNLLPVFPLDGGQVSRELCDWRWYPRGLRISLQISVWTALAVVIYSLVCEGERSSGKLHLLENLPWWFPAGSFYTAILFAILAYQSYQLLQQIGRGGYYYEAPDDRMPWER